VIEMSRKKKWIFLFPVAGIIVYLLLYFFAASLYPGGSQADRNSHGYNWMHNYWCNLLSPLALNGMSNTARPYALAGMAVLCLSLILFWWLFFAQPGISAAARILFRACAILSMLFSFFIFTNWHDRVINIAGLFGLVALGAIYGMLAHEKRWALFFTGVVGLVLMLANNIMYHTGHFYRLPVVQLVTFVFFLTWISALCIYLHRNFY
jgi:hypothetical protein